MCAFVCVHVCVYMCVYACLGCGYDPTCACKQDACLVYLQALEMLPEEKQWLEEWIRNHRLWTIYCLLCTWWRVPVVIPVTPCSLCVRTYVATCQYVVASPQHTEGRIYNTCTCGFSEVSRGLLKWPPERVDYSMPGQLSKFLASAKANPRGAATVVAVSSGVVAYLMWRSSKKAAAQRQWAHVLISSLLYIHRYTCIMLRSSHAVVIAGIFMMCHVLSMLYTPLN